MTSPNTQRWIEEERAKKREAPRIVKDNVGAKMLDTLSIIIDQHIGHEITTREALLLVLRTYDHYTDQLGPRWLL